MKTEQRLKIALLTRDRIKRHRHIEQSRSQQAEEIAMSQNNASQGIAEKMTEAIEELKTVIAGGLHVDNTVEIHGLEELPKAIDKLSDIKLSPQFNIEAPIVNVEPVIVNEDIYARYKRVNSASEGSNTYHGFADSQGNWFIQREAGNDSKASSRYAVGRGSFAGNWSKRQGLDYLPFDEVEIP